MISKSFTLRVLSVGFLLLALPLLVDSFIFFQNSYYDSIKDGEKALQAEATERTAGLLRIQPVKPIYLKELAYILQLSDKLENSQTTTLNQSLKNITETGTGFDLFVLQKEEKALYKFVASTSNISPEDYFLSFRLLEKSLTQGGEGTFIRYAYSKEKKRYVPYVYTALEIKSEKTQASLGLIMAVADIENQLSALIEKADVAETILFAFLNFEGIVIAATDPNLRGQYFGSLTPERRKEIMMSGQFGTNQMALEPLTVVRTNNLPFFEFIFEDQVQIAYRAYAPIGEISLVSYSPKEAFFGVAVGHFLLVYTIYGIVLVLGGGVSYWVSLWISRPLKHLTYMMEQVRAGNLEARFKEEPLGFDINLLGMHFNHTLDNLLENIQHAENERVKIETYQKELEIARQVQQSLLPKVVPVIIGAELSGTHLPAEAVGGAYFGYHAKKSQSQEDVVMISVAEASKEGMPSCLYALSARGLFRTYATLHDDVGQILSLANHEVIGAQEMGMYLKIFYGMYRADSKILSYCACGYAPGCVKKANGEIISFVSSGPAIGLNVSTNYTQSEMQLDSGDYVIIYSEGFLEALSTGQQHYDQETLHNYIQEQAWESAQSCVESLSAEVSEFSGSITRKKEIIIVALKVL